MFEPPKSMDEVADLMRENLPQGTTPAQFGQRMKWGRGSDEARQRIQSLATEELNDIGLTPEQATNWALAYEAVCRLMPHNPSASGRAALTKCVRAGGTDATCRPAVIRRVNHMPTAPTSNATQVLRIRNTSGTAQDLWIEPLGDRVVLTPGILYEIAATDALEEIDFTADGFTVHGWVTRVSSVTSDGRAHTVWELPVDTK